MPLQGYCLCGQTKVIVNSSHSFQILCHCWDCKQTSGSAFGTMIPVLQKDVQIEGPIKTFDAIAANGNTVTRIFCSNCGSAISHTSVGFGSDQAIQSGNFRDLASVPIVAEYFVKDRFDSIAPIDGAEQMQAMQ